MRKLFMLSVIALILPVSTMAQDDDMYFVPTKKNVEKAKADYGIPHDTYYSGSNRSVDEYNRRYEQVVPIDSVGNDIIDFDGTMGAYPDSTGGDYKYTRMMSRWDDYDWKDGYRAGYADGRFGSRWGWGGYYPYYSGWYGGWYDPWYDPWYYGGYWGYAGWYDPWYSWGWGYPHYWYGHHWHGGWYPSYGISVGKRTTGTRNHSTASSGYNYRRYNSIGGSRNTAGNTNNSMNNNVNTNRNYNFGGARNSNAGSYQNTGSSAPSRNTSFGGGGGSRGGGSSSGGGGRFGGGRR